MDLSLGRRGQAARAYIEAAKPRTATDFATGQVRYIVVRGSRAHKLLHLAKNGAAQFFRACRFGVLKNFFRALQSEFFRFELCLDNSTRNHKQSYAGLKGEHDSIRGHVGKQSQG